MRKDEDGNECPGTLGEYRELCAAIGGENCPAVEFLDKKIQEAGGNKDEEVIAADSQMRFLLMPMLMQSPKVKAEYTMGTFLEMMKEKP